MTHLPSLGSIVIHHEINEDAGVDRYKTYTMINSVFDNGFELYILKSQYNEYAIASSLDFENQHFSHDDGFYESYYDPKMRVVDPDNKTIQRNKSEHGIFVVFDVFKNLYSISIPEKSSERVFADIVVELNQMVKKENFDKYIGKTYKYQVKWIKDHYSWNFIYN